MTEKETTVKEGKPDSQVALSRMKQEIEEIAHQKAEKMVQEAKKEAVEIIEDAKEKALDVKNEILRETKNKATRNKVQEISKKKQSLKMDYLATREAILDEIIVEARSELQKYTKSEKYSLFLKELLKASGLSIGGGELVLQLRREDKSHFTQDSLDIIANQITDAVGQQTTITVAEDDIKALGGIKLERSDKKIFVDNTFDTRLERVREEARVALIELLVD